jgi:hypothetical protein
MCKLFLLISYILYFSSAFNCFPYLRVFTLSTASVVIPYACPMFNMWFEYAELILLFQITCICSMHLVWNVLPFCPIYFSGHSRYFIWYMPLSLYLSVRGRSFMKFCIVFRVLNAIFIWVSLNCFVIFLVSFLTVCESGPFFRCYASLSVSVCVRLDFLFIL